MKKILRLPITILPGDYTIFRLDSGSKLPDWVDTSRFYSITDTGEECTVICSGEAVPEEYPHECSMKIFKINKNLKFNETGIINSITTPLAESEIPVFVLSTFDTDYFFIKMEHAYKAVEILGKHHDVDYYSW
ncbi:MAG: hypothetical protein BWY23_01429 [Spirochaetes bacterium ADurb.Bin218]|jgi:hypothetical protein|nr:ACT domain-containing protein [Spirochaetota bacterium]OQA97672.1 MAG: hypothetical protein BWY23_01429 [Spirochaetes bacterium ADurb.Bin218]HOQ11394.1 ACT domain-containing protein [Spirochaetota bacterium]HOV09524.1 ACT domain-containing protein [Spirochaetota bacterium]HPX91249.1 ACT domain-containing protein [Spirochaetota bacterium]